MRTFLLALVTALAVIGISHSSHAACPTPNPNNNAFMGGNKAVDNCQVPAAAVNRLLPAPPDSFGTPIVGADQAAGAFGHPLLIVGGTGATQDAFVGEIQNNSVSAILGFPTGTTGYGLNSSNAGNTVFGAYGLGTLTGYPGSAVGAEFTARNLSGHNPDTNLPPNLSIPTTTGVLDGIHVTCSTAASTKDCSVGEIVGNESGVGTDPNFNTGIYVELYRQYGLFIGAQSSGTQTSAVIQNGSTGENLELQNSGTYGASNALMEADINASSTNLGSGGSGVFALRQSGHIEMAQKTRPTVTSCGSSPSVNSSTDQAGIITTGSGATACTVNFASAFTNIPACVAIGESTGSAVLSISSKSVNGFTVNFSSGGSAINFDYECFDEN